MGSGGEVRVVFFQVLRETERRGKGERVEEGFFWHRCIVVWWLEVWEMQEAEWLLSTPQGSRSAIFKGEGGGRWGYVFSAYVCRLRDTHMDN